MTNVAGTIIQLSPVGNATNAGVKIGYFESTAKAAQNDTITFSNATTILQAFIQVVGTGAAEANTISANVVTLTSATTGNVFGLVYYR